MACAGAVHRRLGAVRPGAQLCRRWCSSARCRASAPARCSRPSRRSCARRSRPRSRAWRWRCSAWRSWSAPRSGPTLGGYIVDNYGWPWIFYINLPVGHARHLHGEALRARARRHPRREPRARRRRSARTWTGRASCCCRSAWRRCSTCSKRAAATTGSTSRDHRDRDVRRGVRAGRLRHPRADRAGAGGRPARCSRTVFLSGTLIGAVMFAMLMSISSCCRSSCRSCWASPPRSRAWR